MLHHIRADIVVSVVQLLLDHIPADSHPERYLIQREALLRAHQKYLSALVRQSGDRRLKKFIRMLEVHLVQRILTVGNVAGLLPQQGKGPGTHLLPADMIDQPVLRHPEKIGLERSQLPQPFPLFPDLKKYILYDLLSHFHTTRKKICILLKAM